MTALHKDLAIGQIHVAHQWEYANSIARLAATGFVTADLHKMALQTNDNTFWLLIAISPIAWAQINPIDPANASRLGVEALKSTSGTIAKGKAVYFTGGVSGGGLPLVELAKANSASTMISIGVSDESFTDSVSGMVIFFGEVSGIDTSSWDPTNILYVSAATAGEMTTTRPTGSNIVQKKAYVALKHATLGAIGVLADNILTLPNLANGKIWVGDSGNAEPTTTDWAHASRHKGGGADVIDNASGSLAGLMSAADKTKLDALTTVRERFIQCETSAALTTGGPFRIRPIGSTGNFGFDFVVPNDFLSLVSLEVIGIPDATFSSKAIYLTSQYGSIGEVYTTHAETDNTKTFSGTQNQFTSINVASVFTALSAGDICGVNLNHQALGTSMNYIGVRIRYNATG